MNTEASAVPINPYQPPQARVADPDVSGELLYVVAPAKFLILMIGTTGLYALYWFYKNWSLLNRRDKSYWPVARAIFAVFFTHSLFDEIDALLRRQVAVAHAWSPVGLATVYVVCVLGNVAAGQLPRFGLAPQLAVFVLQQISFVVTTFVLYRAQRAINIAEGDASGARNRALTGANVAWICLGVLLWLFALLGFYLLLSGRVPLPPR